MECLIAPFIPCAFLSSDTRDCSTLKCMAWEKLKKEEKEEEEKKKTEDKKKNGQEEELSKGKEKLQIYIQILVMSFFHIS